MSLSLVRKLDRRLIRYSTIPFQAIEALAEVIHCGSAVVANYLQLVKRMSTDWVYINALPAGNYWGEWKPRRGGTREPVHYRLYDDALGQDYHLHDTYPTDYFLREGDYVSYIYRKCIG